MDYTGEVFNYNSFTTSDTFYQNELFSFLENNSNYVNTDSLDIKYDLGISIVHFNARSAAAHIDEIILFLDSFTFIFKIIVITETWLHEEFFLFVFCNINLKMVTCGCVSCGLSVI